jgi:hypothetical protein
MHPMNPVFQMAASTARPADTRRAGRSERSRRRSAAGDSTPGSAKAFLMRFWTVFAPDRRSSAAA